ncbi:hypothetical protein V7S43_008200 [Phytophthora oleae]|uniref:Uncharacterized protein n=1 Tax=Phytophthora oleae TaxID=2107226 RepID=A0ABD3FI34_9STRA
MACGKKKRGKPCHEGKENIVPTKEKKVEVAACGCFSTTRTKSAEEKLVSVGRIPIEQQAAAWTSCVFVYMLPGSCERQRRRLLDKTVQGWPSPFQTKPF